MPQTGPYISVKDTAHGLLSPSQVRCFFRASEAQLDCIFALIAWQPKLAFSEGEVARRMARAKAWSSAPFLFLWHCIVRPMLYYVYRFLDANMSMPSTYRAIPKHPPLARKKYLRRPWTA